MKLFLLTFDLFCLSLEGNLGVSNFKSICYSELLDLEDVLESYFLIFVYENSLSIVIFLFFGYLSTASSILTLKFDLSLSTTGLLLELFLF